MYVLSEDYNDAKRVNSKKGQDLCSRKYFPLEVIKCHLNICSDPMHSVVNTVAVSLRPLV